MYGFQSAAREGIFLYQLHSGGDGNLLQCRALLEGVALYGLDGRGQFYAAQVRAACKPRAAHVAETCRLEALEVGERAQVGVVREAPVEEVGRRQQRGIVPVAPFLGVVVVPRAGYVVLVFQVFQLAQHHVVGGLEQAGHEAVLQFHPRGVGLKPFPLLLGHAEAHVGRAVEHALAQPYHAGLHGLGLVDAVGTQINHIHILQVGAVGEARVLQCHLQVGVRIARPQPSGHIPETDGLHVLVASESFTGGIVQLVVVVRADVVEESHRALVLRDVVVVGSHGHQVLYLVAQVLRNLLRAAVVGVCILHAELGVLHFRLGRGRGKAAF